MPTPRHALFVDRDDGALRALTHAATAQGFRTSATADPHAARDLIGRTSPAVVVVEAGLVEGQVVPFFRDWVHRKHFLLVVASSRATVEAAVDAMRQGAHEYLAKPFLPDRLDALFLAARNHAARLPQAANSPDGFSRTRDRFGALWGVSAPMQQVFDLIERAAPTDAGVLITGESGTGKDLAAQTLHYASERANGEFLPVNCSAIAPGLIESELFGHEKGSVSGANFTRRGYFECANGGTLFLDEVTEMPLDLQARLLGVVESGMVTRLGGTTPCTTDVRIVAATHRDPKEAVAMGLLREDLLYRLDVFPVHLPPLRERREDIELLADQFIGALNRGGNTAKRFTRPALEQLKAHEWPGNVRELRNVVHRAFILADTAIGPEHLPDPNAWTPRARSEGELAIRVGMSVDEAERKLILATLEQCNGNKRRAAETLRVSLKTLYNRLNAYKRL